MKTKEINEVLTMTRFEKDDAEYQLMGDFYKIFQLVYQTKDDDRYYAQVTHLLQEFYNKYKDKVDEEFLLDLSGSIGAYVDRKAIKERQQPVAEQELN